MVVISEWQCASLAPAEDRRCPGGHYVSTAVELEEGDRMDSNTKDVLLVVAPALAGLVGAWLGASATKEATNEDRRDREDVEALTQLSALTLPLQDALQLMIRSRGLAMHDADRLRSTFGELRADEKRLAGELAQPIPGAQAALIVAGVSWEATANALGYVRGVATELNAGCADPGAVECWNRRLEHGVWARDALQLLFDLLHRTRRYRRSQEAVSRASWMRTPAAIEKTLWPETDASGDPVSLRTA